MAVSSQVNNLVAEWVPGDRSRSRNPIDEEIASIFTAQDNASMVHLTTSVTKIFVDYLESYICFGEREWTRLSGRVSPPPLLPLNFSLLWKGPCPIFPGKKMCETHLLVYFPALVNDRPLTLRMFEAIAKAYFAQHDAAYHDIIAPCLEVIGDEPVERSYWAVMTINILPDSIGKSHSAREDMIDDIVKKTFQAYRTPQTLEAAICRLSTHLQFQTFLFPPVYTECSENIHGCRMVVGGSISEGLDIRPIYYDTVRSGISLLQKLE